MAVVIPLETKPNISAYDICHKFSQILGWCLSFPPSTHLQPISYMFCKSQNVLLEEWNGTLAANWELNLSY
jgi:hypothetical protein